MKIFEITSKMNACAGGRGERLLGAAREARGAGAASEARLLDVARGDEEVEEVLEGGELRDELLDDGRERLEDRVVVDRRLLERDLRRLHLRRRQLLGELRLDLALALVALLLAERVDLVQEDLDRDVRVDAVRRHDRRLQPLQRLREVVLRVDHPHERAAAAERDLGLHRRRRGVDVARKVPHLELHKGGVGDVVLHNLVRRLEEERLVRRHLVEDHLLDRRLSGASCAHEKHAWFGWRDWRRRRRRCLRGGRRFAAARHW